MPYMKYGNKKTVVDGITFDSKKEAARYVELKMLQQAGEIQDLLLQPSFELRVDGGKVVGRYFADFKYRQGNRVIVEDVKGVRTDVYRLKKKIVEAVHHIQIVEV
jgi:dsDNA-binding SOS-regulon protein